MKKTKAIMISLVLATMLTGCAGVGQSAVKGNENAYHKISAQEAKKMMDTDPKAIVVDVRTPDEYTEKHIPKARLVPNETIHDQAVDGLQKEDTILVYCRTGHRSKQASDKLVKMGYTHIYDFGGINDWPYETEPGSYKKM